MEVARWLRERKKTDVRYTVSHRRCHGMSFGDLFETRVHMSVVIYGECCAEAIGRSCFSSKSHVKRKESVWRPVLFTLNSLHLLGHDADPI